MPRRNLPGYLKHKPSGQALCVINGHYFYLGKYGSKASRLRYEEVIAEYLSNGKKLPPTRSRTEMTTLEFAIAFLEYAQEYYADDPGTYNHCENAMKPLVKHYGNQPISKFGPLSLKFIRDKWIEAEHSLTTIRKREGQIKNAFRWGQENELIPTDIANAIILVRGLKQGRSKARDPEEVQVHQLLDIDIVLNLAFGSPGGGEPGKRLGRVIENHVPRRLRPNIPGRMIMICKDTHGNTDFRSHSKSRRGGKARTEYFLKLAKKSQWVRGFTSWPPVRVWYFGRNRSRICGRVVKPT